MTLVAQLFFLQIIFGFFSTLLPFSPILSVVRSRFMCILKTWKTFVTNAVNIIFFLNHPTTMTIHAQIQRVDYTTSAHVWPKGKSEADTRV